MNYFTATSEGNIPHLRIRDKRFPIAVLVENAGKLPRPKLTRDGRGLYALPGGGTATADEIRAMRG